MLGARRRRSEKGTWRGHGRCLSTMELMASFAIARLELSAERAGAGASTLTESWCRTVASWLWRLRLGLGLGLILGLGVGRLG
eukprot:547496-Rhodomonas_salina.1